MFTVEREDNPLLYLLNYLLSLALYGDKFAAESMRDIHDAFRAQLPHRKLCLQSKIKSSALDIPVFRTPGPNEAMTFEQVAKLPPRTPS